MDINALRTDSTRIEAGEWVGDVPSLLGLRLKVRGFTSSTYRAALQRAQRAVPRGELNKDGSMPVAVQDRVSAQAMHEAGLIDWEGFEQDGKPVPYDAELARTLLTDPDYRAFRDAVAVAAGEVDALKPPAPRLRPRRLACPHPDAACDQAPDTRARPSDRGPDHHHDGQRPPPPRRPHRVAFIISGASR